MFARPDQPLPAAWLSAVFEAVGHVFGLVEPVLTAFHLSGPDPAWPGFSWFVSWLVSFWQFFVAVRFSDRPERNACSYFFDLSSGWTTVIVFACLADSVVEHRSF